MINFESVRHSHTKVKYQTRETIPIYHHMGYEQALCDALDAKGADAV